jgi:lysophospholipase L1-like esterase
LACSSGAAPGNTDVKNAGPSGEAGTFAGSTNAVAGATSSGGMGASAGGAPSAPGGAAAGGAGSGGTSAGAGGASGSGAVLHIAGDSTAAIFPSSDPRVGWGAVFQASLKPGIQVDDRALSGRSTKSFIDEGAWTALIATVHAGDYVFIGFGHNDEKSEDPTRYTDPATTFRDNLKRFVTETRAAGGAPVLLTPISRRKFSGATITASHGAYPDAVKAVATETTTPLLDLTERTKVWLEGLGPEASVAYFAPDDQTHTSLLGAQAIAGLVASELRATQHPLSSMLVP